MNLQNDELAAKILEVAKKFDETAHSKPWNNPQKQRPVADLHYGEDRTPAIDRRSQIRCAKKNIYWYIGVLTPLYSKYQAVIDKYDEKKWNQKNPEEVRIVFNNEEEFFGFVDECLGKNEDNSDINTQLPPKGMSADGFVIICPRCDSKFKRAKRCPNCGQLIKYQED